MNFHSPQPSQKVAKVSVFFCSLKIFISLRLDFTCKFGDDPSDPSDIEYHDFLFDEANTAPATWNSIAYKKYDLDSVPSTLENMAFMTEDVHAELGR